MYQKISDLNNTKESLFEENQANQYMQRELKAAQAQSPSKVKGFASASGEIARSSRFLKKVKQQASGQVVNQSKSKTLQKKESSSSMKLAAKHSPYPEQTLTSQPMYLLQSNSGMLHDKSPKAINEDLEGLDINYERSIDVMPDDNDHQDYDDRDF